MFSSYARAWICTITHLHACDRAHVHAHESPQVCLGAHKSLQQRRYGWLLSTSTLLDSNPCSGEISARQPAIAATVCYYRALPLETCNVWLMLPWHDVRYCFLCAVYKWGPCLQGWVEGPPIPIEVPLWLIICCHCVECSQFGHY